MLVDWSNGVGREVCWSVKWLGKVGRYVGMSNGWVDSQMAGIGREVC